MEVGEIGVVAPRLLHQAHGVMSRFASGDTAFARLRFRVALVSHRRRQQFLRLPGRLGK